MVGDIAIDVSHFSKSYAKKRAVEDVSFSVSRTEIYGLLGPNGAGKTSTLESLGGLRQADGGTLRIMGLDPQSQRARLRDLLGVQLQTSSLPSNITPREALELFSAYRHIRPPYEILERFGLSHASGQFETLSMGQKRRLALALAVAHRPAVVILDEPTAGLDVQSRAVLHSIIQEIRSQGSAVLLSTHDMAEAEALADRVGILLRGRLVAEGTPRQLTAAGARHTQITVRTTQGTLREASLAAVTKRSRQGDYFIFSSPDVSATLVSMIRFLDDRRDRVEDMRVERPSLEERFLDITGGGEDA